MTKHKGSEGSEEMCISGVGLPLLLQLRAKVNRLEFPRRNKHTEFWLGIAMSGLRNPRQHHRPERQLPRPVHAREEAANRTPRARGH